MNLFVLIYHLLVIGVLLFVLLNFLLNQLAVPRLLPRKISPETAPLVSILVPARNEEAVIERCLHSLQAQDYPNYEIILLDDQSSDRTAEIARSAGFSSDSEQCRLIAGQPLPEDWIGKPWACHQLYQAARGEWLLFTDADTAHAPFALSAAVGEAMDRRADLLTLWPEQETKTWSEKWVIPIIYVAAAGAIPHWLLRLGQIYPQVRTFLSAKQWRGMGAANGQYVLFSRKGYKTIGGHTAVKNHLVEDVSLGRTVAGKTREGMILVNCDGTGVVKTRMYQNFPQLWEGFTKNAWPIFDGNFVFFCIGLTGQFLVFVGPFILLWFANFSWLMILFQILLIYFLRILFSWRYQTSWLGTVCHPLGYILATAIAINSYVQSRRKGLTWKGRTYQVG